MTVLAPVATSDGYQVPESHSGIGYDENLVTRVRTDKSSISLLRKLLNV